MRIRRVAVVADESGKLAENVGLSAEQISKLVDELSTESDEAIVSMRESTTDLNNGRSELGSILQSLENITSAATRGADMVTQIEASRALVFAAAPKYDPGAPEPPGVRRGARPAGWGGGTPGVSSDAPPAASAWWPPPPFSTRTSPNSPP